LKIVEIGRVLKPHGLAGEVKVRLHWAGSNVLRSARRLLLRREGEPDRTVEVECVRGSSHGPLLKLEGVDDRDRADALRGALLCLPREALPALEPGEYYLVDLIGAEVVGPDGHIGEVVEVRVHPSVDCAVIRLADGRLAEQPLSAPWVEEVEVEAGRITLASSDGLIL
jgi:16S rRNA processing protein RimM